MNFTYIRGGQSDKWHSMEGEPTPERPALTFCNESIRVREKCHDRLTVIVGGQTGICGICDEQLSLRLTRERMAS